MKSWLKREESLQNFLVVIISMTVMLPMLILNENYSFTVHDHLDSWPPLFEVLRRSGNFFSPDSSLPIFNGLSTCFLTMDYGIYRWLNFLFGFVGADIISRGLAILVGYFSMLYLLDKFDFTNENIGIKKLVAICYAISPVYPMWIMSFAVLPFIIRNCYDCFTSPQNKLLKKDFVYILFGFLVYFPAIGVFVSGIWLLSAIISSLKYKKINKRMFYIFLIMIFTSIISNINILIYTIRGDETNRMLFVSGKILGLDESLAHALKAMFDVHYSVKPILEFISPLLVVIFAIMIFCALKKRSFFFDKNRYKIFCTAISVFLYIYLLSFLSVNHGLWKALFAEVAPFFKGFNFSRVHFLANPLWYLLFFLMMAWLYTFIKSKKIFYVIILIQVATIVSSSGYYRDTYRNWKILVAGQNSTSFKEYYSVEYFSELKKEINYQNEGCVSVGYHPAVAIYNGFNTLDGYLPVNPMYYHDAFRRIIAPTLDKFPNIRSYYDKWGGRLYVYTSPGDRNDGSFRNVSFTSKKSTEKRNLYIDTESFTKMGGKYILSKFIIDNATEIGIELIKCFEMKGEPYHVYIYMVS